MSVINLLLESRPVSGKEMTINLPENVSDSFHDHSYYVRSATYFSNNWPMNFWNGEFDSMEKEAVLMWDWPKGIC